MHRNSPVGPVQKRLSIPIALRSSNLSQSHDSSSGRKACDGLFLRSRNSDPRGRSPRLARRSRFLEDGWTTREWSVRAARRSSRSTRALRPIVGKMRRTFKFESYRTVVRERRTVRKAHALLYFFPFYRSSAAAAVLNPEDSKRTARHRTPREEKEPERKKAVHISRR